MAEGNVDVFSIVETQKITGEKKIKIDSCKVFETRRESKNGGLACAVRESTGVSFSQHNPTISNPDLAYVACERLWVKYKSDQGRSEICTTYLGFQAADNRHYEWNVGIYKVLEEEIREKWSQIFVSGIGSVHSESEEKSLFKLKRGLFLTFRMGTSNARNKNLRPLFNTNIPPISGKYGLRNHFWSLESGFLMRKREENDFFSKICNNSILRFTYLKSAQNF